MLSFIFDVDTLKNTIGIEYTQVIHENYFDLVQWECIYKIRDRVD